MRIIQAASAGAAQPTRVPLTPLHFAVPLNSKTKREIMRGHEEGGQQARKEPERVDTVSGRLLGLW